MSLRALLGGVLMAGAGIVLYEIMTGKARNSIAPPVGSSLVPGGSNVGAVGDTSNYLDVLASIESSNRPYVKASTSSASGLYQFTKATWQALGGAWGNDPSKAFGGLTPSIEEQQMRAQKLTSQNASILQRAGIAITNATLYAAHFLGPTAAVKALAAPASVAVASVIGSSAVKANPFLNGMSVSGFFDWLTGKVGA